MGGSRMDGDDDNRHGSQGGGGCVPTMYHHSHDFWGSKLSKTSKSYYIKFHKYLLKLEFKREKEMLIEMVANMISWSLGNQLSLDQLYVYHMSLLLLLLFFN